jgi:hypothetical protein
MGRKNRAYREIPSCSVEAEMPAEVETMAVEMEATTVWKLQPPSSGSRCAETAAAAPGPGTTEERRGWRRGGVVEDWSGRRRGVVDDEEPGGCDDSGGRERRGRRRPESGGGEASARGKGESRVVVSWVARLPNDGVIWPEDKFHVVGDPGKRGGSLGDYGLPKGPLGSVCDPTFSLFVWLVADGWY